VTVRDVAPQADLRLVPTERYTSAAFARREADALWRHVWQMVCREEDVANPGDCWTHVIVDQPIVVVRTEAGSLRAFHNVCRHRGNVLKRDRENTTELRCSYHGWCWSLDGDCTNVTDAEDFGWPDPDVLRLPELRLATWGGFVFVNPDPDAVPFEDWIAPVAAAAAPYRIEDMRWQAVISTMVPCNWKVGVEAFIESYHITATHPQGTCATDDTSAVYSELGEHGLMVVSMGRPSGRLGVTDETPMLGDMVEGVIPLQKLLPHQLERLRRIGDGREVLPAGVKLRDVLIELTRERAELGGWADPSFSGDDWYNQHEFHVFPNLVLGIIPGELFGFRFLPDGLDPDRCTFEMLSLRFPSADDRPFRRVELPYSNDPATRRQTWGAILHQDFANLESVQQGLHSQSLHHVRLARRQESLIAHLHDVIDDYLARRSAQ
jgi:phenylpropionate dioxygenase-like ring-hydroxylating dioxygenase large terminal subunit